MASRGVVIVVCVLAFVHCVLGNPLLERQARELLSKRQQLALLKRLVNDLDLQLAHLQKRTCQLGIPGALEGCDANASNNHRLDQDFISSLNSPGKRSTCKWGPNGFMDGCDAQSALEAIKNHNFINSLQSPGKRQAESETFESSDQ